jgi:CubicO group peptidase (beta-lactamase class C family)
MRFTGAFLAVMMPLAGLAEPASLDAELDELCQKYAVPGMAAALWHDGEVVAQGAGGVRKHGNPVRVTVYDKFNIGSCTKSVTATLAAVLVERGVVRWDTTLGEAFPLWRTTMLPEWRGVTLTMLLSHQAGLPTQTSDLAPEVGLMIDYTLLPRDQRASLTRQVLRKQKPLTPPGTAHHYSNVSYAIAGHLLETMARGKWEDLVRQHVYVPLGMTTAGFGAPAYPGRVDQPWGHQKKSDGTLSPVPGGKVGDNPPSIGPAATAHAGTLDLLKYLVAHLRGERGEETTLLKAETWRELHVSHFPPIGYAFGWGLGPWPALGADTFGHDGSNTLNYTLMRVAPGRNAAVVINANCADKDSQKAVYEMLDRLTARLNPAPRS